MTVPWEEVKNIRYNQIMGEQQDGLSFTKVTHKTDIAIQYVKTHPAFSEAVASLVPLASKARAANGLS